MSNKDFYDKKPVGETIARDVALELAMARYGIDIRSPEEIERDRKDAERARRWWDKTGGQIE